MIKNILITAGGTSEAIDGVRKISNFSTGSLGAALYEAAVEHLAKETDSQIKYQIHYLIAEGATQPQVSDNLPIIFYPITDVACLEKTLEEVLKKEKIDFLIHAMAVSDFTKDYLIDRRDLTQELTDKIKEAMDSEQNLGRSLSKNNLQTLIAATLKEPDRLIDSNAKLSSDSDLLITLKKTPKIIGKIKEWSPETFLVGFKLLKNVPEEELIRVAHEMAQKNSCDLVLANDLGKIDGQEHEGLLLKGNKILGRFASKKEIARGIIEEVLK